MKTGVLEVIGEAELERSAAISAALAANDRLKYFFSLLQMAAAMRIIPISPRAVCVASAWRAASRIRRSMSWWPRRDATANVTNYRVGPKYASRSPKTWV